MRPLAAMFLCAAALQAGTYFEPNRGQAPARVEFMARTRQGAVAVAGGRMEVRRRDGSRLVMTLDGARRGRGAQTESPLPGVSHYASGRDPARWVWGVPHYGAVRFPGIYPGIDLLYKSRKDDLEFDFVLAPGADAARIALRFSEPAVLDNGGRLKVGRTTLHAPVAWQAIGGRRVAVAAWFAPRAGGRMGFRLGSYDRTQPLTIDPIVEFATFLGGSDNEGDTRLAVSPEGALFVAGSTLSVDFPAERVGESVLNYPQYVMAPDVYVSRLKEDGSALEWSLFLGGNGDERAQDLRYDAFGNVLLLGATSSPNFPVTEGAYDTRIARTLSDQFVLKLDGKTGRLKAATFLGSRSPMPSETAPAHLALDPAGGVYVLGLYRGEFSTTPGAFQTSDPARTSGWFLMRLNAALSARVYATRFDLGAPAVFAVDASGAAIVGGSWEASGPFPAVNPIPDVSEAVPGSRQAYVARLNPQGSALQFASLLQGGDRSCYILGLRLGPDGNIELLGQASGVSFPRVRPLDPGEPASPRAAPDPALFLATMPAEGGALLQSTVLDHPALAPASAPAFAVSGSGKICVMGLGSADMALTPGGVPNADDYWQGGLLCTNNERTGFELKSAPPGGTETRVMEFLPDGRLALAGVTSGGFEATPGAAQPVFGGFANRSAPAPSLDWGDAFVLKMSLDNPRPVAVQVTPAVVVKDQVISRQGRLDLYGDGFGFHTSVVTEDGTGLAAESYGWHHLTVWPFNFSALHAGANRLTLWLPEPGGGSSEIEIQVRNATPDRPMVAPAMVAQGSGELKVVAWGRGILPDSILLWDGEPRASRFSSGPPDRLETTLSADEIGTAGSHRVAVRNPPPGGGDSLEAVFTVQAASGTTVPVLGPVLGTVACDAAAPDGTTVTVTGQGFVTSSQAFWDGTEVPAQYVSATSLKVTPPVEDLRRWGAHQVAVRNGDHRSGNMRVFVGRQVNGRYWTADPAGGLLYGLADRQDVPAAVDLLILDAATGATLKTVETGLAYGYSLAVSDDGRYVYFSGVSQMGGQAAEIVRYDTELGGISLRWQPRDSDGAILQQAPILLALPGQPKTIAANMGERGVFLYDDAVARGRVERGSSVLGFATASRMYLADSVPGCWRWLDYDDSGVTAFHYACETAMPADAVEDGGMVYLTDGKRVYPVAAPYMPSSAGYTPSLAVQPEARRGFAYVYSNTMQAFDLDTGQQPQILQPLYPSSARTLLALPERLLMVDGAWVVPLL